MKEREKEKEKGFTLIASVVTMVVLLILVGIALQNSGVMEIAARIVGEYQIGMISEEVELAMVGLQIDYYQAAYVEEEAGIPNTFGTYVAQKLQKEGIETAEGKLVSTDGVTVIYQDIEGNNIATGILDADIGSVSINGITPRFSEESMIYKD